MQNEYKIRVFSEGRVREVAGVYENKIILIDGRGRVRMEEFEGEVMHCSGERDMDGEFLYHKDVVEYVEELYIVHCDTRKGLRFQLIGGTGMGILPPKATKKVGTVFDELYTL